MNAIKSFALAMLLASAATAAQAQIAVYTDRNPFLAAVSNPAGPISSYFYPAGTPGDVWLASHNLYDSTGSGSRWPTINDLTMGIAPIPEPSSYRMLLAGMLTLGWLSCRRR